MIPVIICGGFGTKLWPLSRQHKPKHFLPLISGKSLFQLNYETLLTKFKPEEIYISTNQDQVSLAEKQAPEVPAENYIIEPEMRNQGPATGLVAATLYKRGFVDEPFMIIQADVVREPIDGFIKMIEECDSLARSTSAYITGGFKPTHSIMGVDYLVKGEPIASNSNVKTYKVAKFVWRSTKEETEELIKADNSLVHTNHTCMTPRNFMEMMKKYKPEWYTPLMNIANGSEVNMEFVKMPIGPIEDVTQKVHEAGESIVVELPFVWDDIGTFESLDKYLKGKDMYTTLDSVVDMNGKSNFVKLDDSNKVVVLIGVDNLIVVDTGDVLLVCDKKQSGQVGEALKEVKNRKLALT